MSMQCASAPIVRLDPNNEYAIATDSSGYVPTNDDPANCTNDVLVQQSTYHVENSNDVIIGPVTHFHCPVTIIQKCQDETRKITALHANDTESASNKTSANQTPQESRRTAHQKCKRRRMSLPVILIIAILIAIAFMAAVTVIFSQAATDEMFENVTTPDSEDCINAESDACNMESQVIPRSLWGARLPLSKRKLETPVRYILVAHTAGASCENVSSCSSILQTLQSYAVEHNSPDIGYNFLIGGDGSIYVGRGWDAINYLQNHCIAVAFIGNYIYDEFTGKMQQALRDTIRMGITKRKILQNYTLLSHSQTGPTMSPGINIRSVIEQWPHYYRRDYIELPD